MLTPSILTKNNMCAKTSELQLLQESYLASSESFTCEVWSCRAKAYKASFMLEGVEEVTMDLLGAHTEVLQTRLCDHETQNKRWRRLSTFSFFNLFFPCTVELITSWVCASR